MCPVRILWDILYGHLPQFLLWSVVGALVGSLLAVWLILWWDSWIGRKRWLEMGFLVDPLLVQTVRAVWIVGVPVLGLFTGGLVGMAGGARAFLYQAPVVERAGEVAFETAVGLALAYSERLPAETYLTGAREIRVEDLEKIQELPDTFVAEARDRARAALAGEREGVGPRLVDWFLNQAVTVWTRSSSSRRAQLTAPVLAELRSSDPDGLVSVQQVSVAICRVHLRPMVASAVYGLFLAPIVAVVSLIPVLMLAPVAVTRLVAWLRKHA